MGTGVVADFFNFGVLDLEESGDVLGLAPLSRRREKTGILPSLPAGRGMRDLGSRPLLLAGWELGVGLVVVEGDPQTDEGLGYEGGSSVHKQHYIVIGQ